MSPSTKDSPLALPDSSYPTVSSESFAVYAALLAGLAGGIFGLMLAFINPLPLSGPSSFGVVAASAAGIVGAVIAVLGYWRVRGKPGQEWRRAVFSPLIIVSFAGVVLVHSLLSALAVYAAYLVLGFGFEGLVLDEFWSSLMMAATTGLTSWVVYLSVSQLSTVRMSNLLMAFVGLGTITAMVTAADPGWWQIHFSHLGTFADLSSLIFNGTLIVGGLLVTAFSIYVSNDVAKLVDPGIMRNSWSPRFVALMFVIMGAMLAGVGLVPVTVSLLIHNLCASGMAVAFGVLLISGPWTLRGLPLAYFVASGVFLLAVVASVILFIAGYFGLTAFEILVFAFVFGWISVFIRFLDVVSPAVIESAREPKMTQK